MREVFINGEWHEENTRLIWPDAVKIALLNVNLELYPGKPDISIWSPDSRGEFTISSAWGIFRQRRGISTTDSKIWHRAVPFKMAFPTWRAIYGRLPTDERVARMGFALVARCFCCRTPSAETTEHLFCSGAFAKSVWANFCAPFGIDCRNTQLLQLLLSW